METKRFFPDKEKCSDLAEKTFLSMAGLEKAGRKYERMREDAMDIAGEVKECADIKAIYRYFDRVELKGRKAYIGSESFTCPAFEQIDAHYVKGAYVYAVSAGVFDLTGRSLMDRLYADIWGSAFADAARLLLWENLSQNSVLSDSFGPGFYGMKMNEIRKIDVLIGLGNAGIGLNDNNVMIPLKSCAGIIFSVNNEYRQLKEECVQCKGNYKSCRMCAIHDRNEGEKNV